MLLNGALQPLWRMLHSNGHHPLQAEQQLGKDWMLMRAGTAGCPEIPEWLADTLHEGARVGIDPFLHTVFAPSGLLHRVEKLAAHIAEQGCLLQAVAWMQLEHHFLASLGSCPAECLPGHSMILRKGKPTCLQDDRRLACGLLLQAPARSPGCPALHRDQGAAA